MKVIAMVVAITPVMSPKLEFKMTVNINANPFEHERTKRRYSSPEDALTSARHLVKEVNKQKP